MPASVADELARLIGTAEPVLRSLTEAAVSSRPASDRWTIKEVIGHLIDSAANNHQRFVRAQGAPELIFPKYEQNDWIRCQHYGEVEWFALLDLWSAYNRHLCHVIRHVAPEALAVRCVIGPYEPVTLRFLIEDYVVHHKHHLQKIAERPEVARPSLFI